MRVLQDDDDEIQCPECGAPVSSRSSVNGEPRGFTCGSTPESLAEGVHISNAREAALWRKRQYERAQATMRELESAYVREAA